MVALFSQLSTETQATPPAAKIFPGPVNSVGGFWPRVVAEFEASAVSEALALANIEILRGQALLQELTQYAVAGLGGHSQQYVTAEVQRILKKYEAVADGGAWLCYGQTLTGEQGDVPIIKPFNPRVVTEGRGFRIREKVLKYENPLKAPAPPVLPVVPGDYVKRIKERWGVNLRNDVPFWRAIQENPTVPVAITEGLKKALSLIEQGIPAICLRGVTMWKNPGTDEIASELRAFAQKGRKILLFFDQDEKPKSRKQVFQQTVKLGGEFQRLGCDFRCVVWDSELGKGIDDVLWGLLKNERWNWLSGLVQNPPTLSQFKRKESSAISLSQIAQNQNLSLYSIERETCGQYLPKLPELSAGTIHALSAPTGSGKSTRIGQDWVKPWKERSQHFVIVLSPLNSLGQQAAKQWGIPHIHSFSLDKVSQEGLDRTMRADGGIVLCPDSLLRLPDWIWGQKILLVLDEANQVIDHIIRGQTLGNRWAAINEVFAKLIINSLAIIAAEANLSPQTLEFLRTISKKDLRLFRHTNGDKTPWPVFFYQGHSSHISGFFADLLERLKRGEKILFLSSSKFAGKRLEVLVQETYPNLKIERIDSDTNDGVRFSEFFEDPDRWIETNQPDLLICSPTAKTGLSIQGGVPVSQAYFKSVWGYFPCGTGDVHYQMLSRFRPPVHRFIYCAEKILPEGDENFSSETIKKNLKQDVLGLAQAFGMQDLLKASEPTIEKIQEAIFHFYSQYLENSAVKKFAGADYLVSLLLRDGHQISYIPLQNNPDTKKALADAKQTVLYQEAQDLANATITKEMNVEWANKILLSQSSYQVRCQAKKFLLRNEFPGINFDDVDFCLEAVVKNYSSLIQGVRLRAYAEDLPSTQNLDAERLYEVLKKPLKAIHKTPKNLISSKLIAETGVLNLIGKTYSESTPEVLKIKEKALQYQQLIWRYLRLNVQPDQHPVHVVNKLLRRVGIEPKYVARPGHKKRERIYEAIPNEVHSQLLEALKRKLANRPPFSFGGDHRENGGRFVSTDYPLVSSNGTSAVQNPNPPPPEKPPAP